MISRIPLLADLALRLTQARLRAKQGESLLYLSALVAYIVCGALAMTIAAGTWMFYQRWQHPTGLLAQAIAEDHTFLDVPMFYFVLALIACALVVPSIISLAAGAAVLGARGRERRLSVLRLIGLSSGEVTLISLVDTLIQALVGVAVGCVVYAITIPLWQGISFIGMRLEPAEMTLPWQLGLAVATGVVLTGLFATWWGLRQVRISPLGVARRSSRPGVKAWRLVAFFAIMAGTTLGMGALRLGSDYLAYVMLVTIMLVMIYGFNLVGPYLLQVFARLLAKLGPPSMMWASRRVAADPRAVWSRVVGLGLLTLAAGYISTMPFEFNTELSGAAGVIGSSSRFDFSQGAIIALAAGLIVNATGLFISQASAVLERREQSIALQRMGAADSFANRAMWFETLGPTTVSLILGYGLGVFLAMPMARMAAKFGVESGIQAQVATAIVLAAGLVMAAVAVAACQPIQAQILATHTRRND